MCAIMPIVIESVGDQGQRVEQGFEWPDDSATDRLLVRPGADGRRREMTHQRAARIVESIAVLIPSAPSGSRHEPPWVPGPHNPSTI
jgi:hypothetical protein